MRAFPLIQQHNTTLFFPSFSLQLKETQRKQRKEKEKVCERYE
jgi:hypothetical protein